jgi:xanthine dehydrogenase accessory factor
MDADLLKQLNAARENRKAAYLITPLGSEGPEQRLIVGDVPDDDPLVDQLTKAKRTGKSFVDAEQGVFIGTYVPSPRFVIIGAVHISQALAPMAVQLGYDVTLIDPRTAFATPERFPGLNLIPEWPDEVLPQIGLDPWTAFAALTHDPKIDDVGITSALEAECFYVGALGSRKTHGRRIDRLTEAGVSSEALARIHAPIGLPIGAMSPAEIAIAILAEVTSILRGGKITQEILA